MTGAQSKPKTKGAAVLLDARTGEVLALASLPAFDPATLTPASWAALQTRPDGPAFHRALRGLYPPGSSFKIVTAAAALARGQGGLVVDCPHTITNVHWRFPNRPGGRAYSRRRITDEEGFVPHGETDMAKALRVSCNVYFARLGIRLGADALDQTATQQFGLAHLPSVAKLGEDLPDCAYGQGAVLVTPLEMARVGQAVANGGQMLPPVFFKDTPPGPAVTAMPSDQAVSLQTMLASVVTDGTAKGVFDGLPVSVAGKTGSAQNNQGDGQTHSWFVGFAPAVNAPPSPSPASWRTAASGGPPPPPSAATWSARRSQSSPRPEQSEPFQVQRYFSHRRPRMNASPQAHRVETTLTQDGTLTLDHLPFQAGDSVEVRSQAAVPSPQDRYPLRGTPVQYKRPFEPAVAEDEWEAAA